MEQLRAAMASLESTLAHRPQELHDLLLVSPDRHTAALAAKATLDAVEDLGDAAGGPVTHCLQAPGEVMASACCKHYVANSMDGSTVDGPTATRVDFNAVISEQDLVDSYLAPFQDCVEQGEVSSLMCSYSKCSLSLCVFFGRSSKQRLHRLGQWQALVRQPLAAANRGSRPVAV